MRSPFLTRSHPSADDRPAAICLMTVLATLLMSPRALAQPDEHAPPPLIDRGLQALSARSVSDRALAAASFMPELRLRAIFEDATWTGRRATSTTILGELAWPLGRTPVGSAVDAAALRRQRSRERDSLVERIAAAWHERRRLEELGDDIASEIDREEADAELDALIEDEP